MKKRYMMGLLFGMTVVVCAQSYVANIEVAPVKKGGKSWDVAGGAPDVLLKVEGTFVPFRDVCQDSYRCKTNAFETKKKVLYVEVYDRDVAANDLIGKGTCRIGERCRVGEATVKFEEGKPSAVVIADARYDLQKQIGQLTDTLYTQVMTTQKPDISAMQTLIAHIEHLQGYGERLSQSNRAKLQKLLNAVEGMKENDVASYAEKLKKLLQQTPAMVG